MKSQREIPSNGEFLTTQDLAARWRGLIAASTLANWRTLNRGPAYFKTGGKVLYSVEDVVAYELDNTHLLGVKHRSGF